MRKDVDEVCSIEFSLAERGTMVLISPYILPMLQRRLPMMILGHNIDAGHYPYILALYPEGRIEI
ncbi:MAG: hypothetical protein ACE5IR_13200 [bacterium]